MATREEEQMRQPRSIGGAMGGTLGSNLQLGGFNNPMGFTPPNPSSVFGASTQKSSQDFSRLQVPTTPNIPLGNTVPVFPDNYNRVMGERMRAPSSMVSGVREGDLSGFSPYNQTVPSMGGLTQAPPMAPATNAITSFGNPMASRTERIETPYGTATTTLNPEQQAFRFQARQQAEQSGTMPRTPQQQQDLLARMRTQGAAIRESIASNARDSFGTKTPAQTYTTPSGSSIVAPTNMFGQPIQSFSDVYAARSPINESALARMRGRPPASTYSSDILASTGFGAMQREQNEMMPPTIRNQSLFGNMGYPAAIGGGPQPASSMVTGDSMVGRTRKRLFGTV